jgi:hypothetical protein
MHEHHTPDDAFAALFEHRGSLLRYLRTKVASPELAEDLLQDCLLKALRSAPELRDKEKLLPLNSRLSHGVTGAVPSVYTGEPNDIPEHMEDTIWTAA